MRLDSEKRRSGTSMGHSVAGIGMKTPSGGRARVDFSDRDSAAEEAALPYDLVVLRSLRKIIRAIDLYSRQLSDICGLTVPQLICLSAIARSKRLTAIELAKFVHISPSTLVGILDRLELKQFIRRERNLSDRRQIFISMTSLGRKIFSQAPSPLQASLANGLQRLSLKERANIAHSLKNIVDLMEADNIEAAPILILDGRNYAVPGNRSNGKLRGVR